MFEGASIPNTSQRWDTIVARALPRQKGKTRVSTDATRQHAIGRLSLGGDGYSIGGSQLIGQTTSVWLQGRLAGRDEFDGGVPPVESRLPLIWQSSRVLHLKTRCVLQTKCVSSRARDRASVRRWRVS